MALKGNQKKLDKNNNNRIDAEDFKILKSQKEKVKPVKAVLGIAAMGALGAKMLKDKNKKAMALPGVGAAALLAKKKKEMLGKRMGGVMKAKLGAEIKPKGPGVLRPKPTSGGKPLKPKPIKPNKKMGGGMMKKYNKGGGADTGTMGERRSVMGVFQNKVNRFLKDAPSMNKRDFDKLKERTKTYVKAESKKNTDRLTERDINNAKRAIQSAKAKRATQGFLPSDSMPKKMGGGMIGGSQMPGYSKGKSVKVKCKLGRNKPTKMY